MHYNHCHRATAHWKLHVLLLLLLLLLLMEVNTVLHAVLYLNTSYLQYSLSTVLLTVRLAALNTKLLTELLAAPDLTLTSDTQFKELNC
jgi:uncharacterized integral membrane protein